MAANLQKNGYELVVFNRTRRKAEPLIINGATWAATPAEVAKQVNVLITMLSTPDAVAEMALGKNGFLGCLGTNALWMDGKQALWIDCSTVDPAFSRYMADEAHAYKVRLLDAPVDGSKALAEKGQLVFLAGGEVADLNDAKPILDAMGKSIVHAGGHGMGSAMKLMNVLIMAQAMFAVSEGIVFGLSLGIRKETVFDAILHSPSAAPWLAGKRTKIEYGIFDPDVPLKWMHRDLQLTAAAARETGAALPATNLVKEFYTLAMRAGLGEQDISAVYKILSDGRKEQAEARDSALHTNAVHGHVYNHVYVMGRGLKQIQEVYHGTDKKNGNGKKRLDQIAVTP